MHAKLIENERVLAGGIVIPLETAGFTPMAGGHIHAEYEWMPVGLRGAQPGYPFGGLVVLHL